MLKNNLIQNLMQIKISHAVILIIIHINLSSAYPLQAKRFSKLIPWIDVPLLLKNLVEPMNQTSLVESYHNNTYFSRLDKVCNIPVDRSQNCNFEESLSDINERSVHFESNTTAIEVEPSSNSPNINTLILKNNKFLVPANSEIINSNKISETENETMAEHNNKSGNNFLIGGIIFQDGINESMINSNVPNNNTNHSEGDVVIAKDLPNSENFKTYDNTLNNINLNNFGAVQDDNCNSTVVKESSTVIFGITNNTDRPNNRHFDNNVFNITYDNMFKVKSANSNEVNEKKLNTNELLQENKQLNENNSLHYNMPTENGALYTYNLPNQKCQSQNNIPCNQNKLINNIQPIENHVCITPGIPNLNDVLQKNNVPIDKYNFSDKMPIENEVSYTTCGMPNQDVLEKNKIPTENGLLYTCSTNSLSNQNDVLQNFYLPDNKNKTPDENNIFFSHSLPNQNPSDINTIMIENSALRTHVLPNITTVPPYQTCSSYQKTLCNNMQIDKRVFYTYTVPNQNLFENNKMLIAHCALLTQSMPNKHSVLQFITAPNNQETLGHIVPIQKDVLYTYMVPNQNTLQNNKIPIENSILHVHNMPNKYQFPQFITAPNNQIIQSHNMTVEKMLFDTPNQNYIFQKHNSNINKLQNFFTTMGHTYMFIQSHNPKFYNTEKPEREQVNKSIESVDNSTDKGEILTVHIFNEGSKTDGQNLRTTDHDFKSVSNTNNEEMPIENQKQNATNQNNNKINTTDTSCGNSKTDFSTNNNNEKICTCTSESENIISTYSDKTDIEKDSNICSKCTQELTNTPKNDNNCVTEEPLQTTKTNCFLGYKSLQYTPVTTPWPLSTTVKHSYTYRITLDNLKPRQSEKPITKSKKPKDKMLVYKVPYRIKVENKRK